MYTNFATIPGAMLTRSASRRTTSGGRRCGTRRSCPATTAGTGARATATAGIQVAPFYFFTFVPIGQWIAMSLFVAVLIDSFRRPTGPNVLSFAKSTIVRFLPALVEKLLLPRRA